MLEGWSFVVRVPEEFSVLTGLLVFGYKDLGVVGGARNQD